MITGQSAIHNADESAESVVSRWYESFGGELLVYCQGQMGHHDGQEAFQTMWTKVLKNMEKFSGGNERAWLYRIAKNTMQDMRKKCKPVLSDDAVRGSLDRSNNVLDQFIESEMQQDFKRCFQRLDQAKQQLLQMRILGKSYKSIGSVLGIDTGTVGSRFNRIKDEMRNCIGVK